MGHTHAHDLSGAPGMCGGMANRRVLGKRSNQKESRVDHADQGGWRGAAMAGRHLDVGDTCCVHDIADGGGDGSDGGTEAAATVAAIIITARLLLGCCVNQTT